jgi:hypothetical protein
MIQSNHIRQKEKDIYIFRLIFWSMKVTTISHFVCDKSTIHGTASGYMTITVIMFDDLDWDKFLNYNSASTTSIGQ